MPNKIVFWLLLMVVTSAQAMTPPQDWKTVGNAHLKVLWFSIYKAELQSPSGEFLGFDSSLLLSLDYKRNISKKDLIKETRKQIKPFAPQAKLAPWIEQLENIWPDIAKGDQLRFWIDAEGKGHFFYNQNWIGSLDEPGFSAAFIQIWLSPDSSYPKLARKLRGELNDEKSK